MADEVPKASVLLKGQSFIDTEQAFPQFEDINQIEYSQIPSDVQDAILADYGEPEKPTTKHRGRPKGSKNRTTRGRDAQQVSQRLQGIFKGATGIPAVWREHIEMTEEEAKNIADPLADYLIRQEEYSGYVREFLDSYDIVAAGFAFLVYLVRVWKDESEYRRVERERGETVRPNVVRVETGSRQQESQSSNAPERPSTYEPDAWVSTPPTLGE